MKVTMYEGIDLDEQPTPLGALAAKTVDVRHGWSVADVLEAAGHMPHNSFTLVTPDVEVDVNAGHDQAITGVFNLLGIDAHGVARFDSAHLPWVDFVRAANEGLYEGDPSRVLVQTYGTAGGLMPDGLWAVVQFLLDNRDLAAETMGQVAEVGAGVAALVTGSRWVTGLRRRQIARAWRKHGFTAARARWYLSRQPQWDPKTLETQLALTPLEARLALTKAGYAAAEGRLWRLSESAGAKQMAATLEHIETAAYADIEGGWEDDFPLEDED